MQKIWIIFFECKKKPNFKPFPCWALINLDRNFKRLYLPRLIRNWNEGNGRKVRKKVVDGWHVRERFFSFFPLPCQYDWTFICGKDSKIECWNIDSRKWRFKNTIWTYRNIEKSNLIKYQNISFIKRPILCFKFNVSVFDVPIIFRCPHFRCYRIRRYQLLTLFAVVTISFAEKKYF